MLFAMAAVATPLAHDFWLGASIASPLSGSVHSTVTITAGIGEQFPIRTPFPARGPWLQLWRVLGAEGDVGVAPDFRPAGLEMVSDVRLPTPGAYLGVATVSPQLTEMTWWDFTYYLEEEQMDDVLLAREAAGETTKTAREIFSRYAKVAVRTGPGDAGHLLRPVGHLAEFVPAADPTAVRPGDRLSVQLLVDGQPLAGASVAAVNDGEMTRARTDSEGRVSFLIGRPGAWLIKTVRMVRLPRGAAAEWESYWVTLAFHALPGREGDGVKAQPLTELYRLTLDRRRSRSRSLRSAQEGIRCAAKAAIPELTPQL